jgi:dimethylaniline monooxygenase (N-oxide forming)
MMRLATIRRLSTPTRPYTSRSSIKTDIDTTVVMGCVCYDPAVGDIWAGIKTFLKGQGVPFDYVLFTNYEAQVRSLVNGHIDVAWNGPLAHVMTEELSPSVVSLGMRDVDRDAQSVVVVRKGGSIVHLEDLNHRNILTGSSDSPQAHVVPLLYLKTQLTDLGTVTAFDFDLGKHGDTAVGEIKALEVLSTTKQGDAAVVSKMMWDRAIQGKIHNLDATVMQETCEELVTANIPTFDHCQFDAISTPDNGQKLNDFGLSILSMDWENPEQRVLMKLEGIQKKWELPRQTGYDIVRSAMGLNLAKHRPATNFNYQKRSFSAASPPPRRVAVVGAGIAGLQAVRALKAKGFDVTAYDGASTVGGLWKANYAGFGVQVPKQLFEFQDYPMTSVARGDFATGEEVQTYIESYADDFGLRDSIQLDTKVKSAQQMEDGKWKIQIEPKEGASETLNVDYLVMATGLYSGANKSMPAISGREVFPGEIMHSDDFRDARIAKDKRVVVIGGGKSAIDCALEASRAGASSVTLLQRTAYWPTPRKIAGIIPFQYIFLSRFGTALVSIHCGTFPGGSGSGTAVNAIRNSIGPALMRPVFALVEELFAFQFNLRGDLRPKIDVVSGFYKVASVLNSDLTLAKKAGKVNVRIGEIDEYGSDGTLRLKEDSSVLEADMVVSATGFKQDYSIFSDPETRQNLDLQSDGVYLYRFIVPEKVQNLAFIGHVGAISNISTYGLQAEWLARNLTGSLVSGGTTSETAPASMKEEVETRKSWARSWMPESAYRGMLVLLHQTHYHDQLVSDMGMNPLRKGNVVSEYLMPYEPADYDGIMGGRANGIEATGVETSTK